ncbi:mycothiol system anti-sigma-R factor [Microlunatus capsulatus]|uniref:Anti-sigma factor (TIGR02949 family) n=1 Tax=Microlunatus capsulatus TaxID=99117 RepID=A0ABS4Z4P3_9ACTN|nr:mycothiol system anti-sigma-R factor [Microlunatus capsulatus]MBP2415677.1 anti-sigma factor (TIGR02949 family) [Microlunatus capsulatus]
MSDLQKPPSTDCEHMLARVHEFLDHELDTASSDEIRAHLAACEPCLDQFDVEQAVRSLVNRCCGGDKAPSALRTKVLGQLAAAQATAHAQQA